MHLTGVDGYSFTGEILAWGAERAAAGGLRGVGALGPGRRLRPRRARGRRAREAGLRADLNRLAPGGRSLRRGRLAGPGPVGPRQSLAAASLALAAIALLARSTAGLILGASRARARARARGAEERDAAAAQVTQLPLEQAVGQLLVMSFDGTDRARLHPPPAARRPGHRGDPVRQERPGRAPRCGRSPAGSSGRRAAARSIATDQEGGQIRSVPFAAPRAVPGHPHQPRGRRGRARRAGARGPRRQRHQREPRARGRRGERDRLGDGRPRLPGDADDVRRLVGAAVGLTDAAVAATAKHFPGLGRAGANTDDEPVTLDASRRELERRPGAVQGGDRRRTCRWS